MTNINCVAACIHQKEGKCHCNHASNQAPLLFDEEVNCAYFQPKEG